MTEPAIATALCSPRHRLVRTLAFVSCLLLPAACPARAAQGPAVPPPPSCWSLARVPGPEDLVLDARHERLLVSSQDRRPKPWPPGAIWAVPLDPTGKAAALELAGRRDECSFHPHGIDLVESCDGKPLLYVLNHHAPEDRLPERGCFAAGSLRTAPSGRISSVEVFEVEGRRLRFVQRLADPEVLTNGNDLVARPGGDVWVTNPPAGALAQVLEAAGIRMKSRVVRFQCKSRRGLRCLGAWEVATTLRKPGKGSTAVHARIRYANGIAFQPSSAGRAGACDGADPGFLFVAGGAERRLHRFAVPASGRLQAWGAIELPEGSAYPHPDNLSWVDEARTRLLVAGHPSLRRFVQHSRAAAAPSPSAVVEVRVPPPGAPAEDREVKTVFEDPGGLISAASVAVCAAGDLVLGQVFEPAVLRCRLPEPCGGGEGP